MNWAKRLRNLWRLSKFEPLEVFEKFPELSNAVFPKSSKVVTSTGQKAVIIKRNKVDVAEEFIKDND